MPTPLIQYLLPQHALSKFAGWVACCKFPPLKNYLIQWFIRRYGVNMEEAVSDNLADYENFQSFFIRTLKPSLRPIAQEKNQMVSPVDGIVSQIGGIQAGRIFQAKGFDFTVGELMGGQTSSANRFSGGQFATFYLAPKDYHRVHMPLTGRLLSTTYIPGRLFSVSPQTANQIPRLFARNERLVCLFETLAGPMAVVFVGAMIVGSISTVWAKDITRTKTIQFLEYVNTNITIQKGEELGYFKLGSTVILLFGGQVNWDKELREGSEVKMGEKLA